MRKGWYIASAAVAAAIALVGGLMLYALINLNEIVRDHQAALLARASQLLGRQVTVVSLKASVGLGASITVDGLQVAGDPAFSPLPLVTVREVQCGVQLLPLLSGRLHLSHLALLAPRLNLQQKNGRFNFSTLGRPSDPPWATASAKPASPPAAPAAQLMITGKPRQLPNPINRLLADLRVASLTIEDGTLSYQDAGAPAINITRIALTADHLRLDAPVPVSVVMAVWSVEPNLNAHGWVGPVARGHVLNANAIPLNLALRVGPLALDQLRQVPAIADRVPAQLTLSAPLGAQLTLRGTPARLAFEITTDLSAARLGYTSLFAKPAGLALHLSGRGVASPAAIEVQSATARIDNQEASLSNLVIAPGSWHGELELQHFALAPLAMLIGPLHGDVIAGTADAHLRVSSGAPVPALEGSVVLSGAGVRLRGGTFPALSAVDARLELQGQRAVLEPTRFKIGSSPAQLAGQAQSLYPLQAHWTASASDIKLAQFIPSRAPDDHIDQLNLEGSLEGAGATMRAMVDARSASGLVARVPYRQFTASVMYAGQTLTIQSLSLQAYGGSAQVQGQLVVKQVPALSATAQVRQIDLAQLLAAQHDKDAGAVQGTLSGEVKLAGQGSNWTALQPTLRGTGQGSLVHGKLLGINLVAGAMEQINRVPGIGGLVTASLIARHAELFHSPDTDLGNARMSFTVAGMRLVSRDITAQARDYRLSGAGWFGFDRRLDLEIAVLLSTGLSRDLQAQKKNVVYLMNPQGEIEVPMTVSGRLPKPVVRPDLQVMVARAAQQALKRHGRALLGGLGKRLNNLLGGLP
ncbi:MAG TPA: AsmA-like C-terminal region-containing protein [Candidatus Binataceae bacterium]|nr:AsmA-like C-terminal region-containing protein [Candidatus Binataceae bacterium]